MERSVTWCSLPGEGFSKLYVKMVELVLRNEDSSDLVDDIIIDTFSVKRDVSLRPSSHKVCCVDDLGKDLFRVEPLGDDSELILLIEQTGDE